MRVGRHWTMLDGLSRGRFLTRVRTPEPALYLTFDDGPHPRHTPELLALLAAHGALATFFMVGKTVTEYPQVAAQVAAAGHRLGNHSWSHVRQTRISAAQRRQETSRTEAVLRGVDGAATHPVRPPYGAIPPTLALQCLLGTHGVALWSYDSLDHRGDSADVLRRLRGDAMRPGEILLFHDDAATAREALEVLLPQWRSQGYAFHAL